MIKATTESIGVVTMRRLFGCAVLVGLMLFGLAYVSSHWPSPRRFSCAIGGATAHAEDDSCPGNILAADGDAAWAAARVADINARTAGNGKKHTYGEFYDEDGIEHWYASGQDDAADLARDVGRDAGVFRHRGPSPQWSTSR